jgi:glycyl-tRNA synthetase beta chain
MSSTKSLLVELFVEELPPKSLKKLGDEFASRLADSLKAQGLATDHAAMTVYATPRRFALHLSAVQAQGSDKAVTHKLMPVTVALDASGAPTPALLKKLAAVGADAGVVPQLERKIDGKAEALFWSTTARGATLAAALQIALDETITKLPILKTMSYQLEDGWTSVNFVRPAHGLVALHGAEVVPVTALGLTSGRNTQGHRFEAQMTPVVLQDADHYAQQLETQGAVIAAFDHRRADIVRQLQHAAAPLGLTPIDDDALLDEVTALVERPNVLLCEFEAEFLEVPSECLILTMKANQKYFPLLDAKGALTNKFLVVSNISPDDASAIVQGNERVVRPRLADAKFFFDQDRKKTLESRLPMLDKVVYHAKLGSQGERVERVRAIAKSIGNMLGDESLAKRADRAALLAKADLVTDMVGEFPDLQGVMGGCYALNDGESQTVAHAIEDHYKPRFAGDALPRNEIGIAVALADKLETLVGLFGIGEKPTGDKDPFALRRHALGVIRMLVERELALSLPDLINMAAAELVNPIHQRAWANRVASAPGRAGEGAQSVRVQVPTPVAYVSRTLVSGTEASVEAFIWERFAGNLRDSGFTAQEVDATLAMHPHRLADVPKRLEAVRAFAALPESNSLAAANKRIGNILKKSDRATATSFNPSLLVEPAEKSLASALHFAGPLADKLFDNGEYAASLRELAVLKAPVDAFFDSVMVNADDPALRANRLALLQSLHRAMNRVADLSKLAV